jgi:endoribonuclease Dicer
MSRIDDLLLVKEINVSLFDHVIGENELLIALTIPAAGMDYNYERLELLGSLLNTRCKEFIPVNKVL